jgi:hypothetical protein
LTQSERYRKSLQEKPGLKKFSISLSAAAALAAIFTLTSAAQNPPPAGGPPPPRNWPAPTNLKVLPKNLTGQQVRDIMEKWEGSLGVHCNTCHTADPNNVGPNGRPRLNFADDSKQQKATARLMYTMTEGINRDYVMKIEGAETPVACGTCHRGHLDPEPFVIPEEDHNGPRPPQGAPPAGGAPPSSR